MNLDYFLTPYTKNKCKMDKRLKCKTGNLKTVRNTGTIMFFDIGLRNIFLNLSPQARTTKSKNKLIGLHQTKGFSQQRKPPAKLKGDPQNGRSYL